MFLPLGLFLLPLAVTAHQVNVYHRLHIPNGPQSDFSQRGAIAIEEIQSPTYQASESSPQHFTQFASVLKDTTKQDSEHALYQVALEHNGNWDISSVKWCHLPQITSETLILHTNEASSEPYGIDYFVSPIPHDGACPANSPASPSLDHLANLNTTVLVRTPRLPPLPELRVPPPLTPEGKPVEPVPEKSFIQKYWMYIAAALIALMVSGGPPDESQQAR
ncbi:hypothetical protein V5O48_018295 [Marasmius crinis-equi]|uniref:ER membrane protein complex subunit 10 n=1 Tax=Marasmius crinis-equi TaxID=585013 RepID=A0ABR3ELP0_9AGAR